MSVTVDREIGYMGDHFVEGSEGEHESKDDKMAQLDELVQEPEIGMVFSTIDDMLNFYRKFGKQKGFSVKRRSLNKDKDGTIKYVTFTCGRLGKFKSQSNNALKPRPCVKTGCNARLCGRLYLDGKYVVSHFEDGHNHGLSPSKARFFRCNREISSHIKRQLEINDIAGIRPNKSHNAQVIGAGGHENLPFLERDTRNMIAKVRRLRLGEGDANAVQNYFLKMQSLNEGFFSMIDWDEHGRLKNVFWADPRSRAACKEFGDIITFDTTYLTNKYDMSFAPFVGVNHHGQSILLGCGLISNEDTETFTWLFQTWLACMNDIAPFGIITDQDRVMKNAIAIVFPTSRHHLCLWHIMKKMPEKLGAYTEYDSISLSLAEVVYDSQSQQEFEDLWNLIIHSYNLGDNAWLTTLYDDRHLWVPIFVKTNFWAGMSTTQRSESINAFFDGYVNSKTTLKQFLEQYENALRSKVEKECQADYESFCKQVGCVTFYDMEKQIQAIYTIAKFKEFQSEITGMMYCRIISVDQYEMISMFVVAEDIVYGERGRKRVAYKVLYDADQCDVKCTCYKFEFKGMQCRHVISVLIHNNISLLPEKYIIKRWRKDV